MEQEQKANVEIQPIIDSHNPPISVDNVILGESGTGAVRLACFSGNAFVERENIEQRDGLSVKKIWIRPVSVLDIGTDAVSFIEDYLLYRLSENEAELRTVREHLPEVINKLLKSLNKINEGAENV